MKEFIEAELHEEDKAGMLALHDPDPSGPADHKIVRVYQNNAYSHGLFLTCSRMNHSCAPRVEMSSDDGEETEVRVIGDIKAGQEITVSYLRTSSLLTKQERTAQLQHWGFVCTCRLCRMGPQEQQLNDRQRLKVKRNTKQIRSFFSLLSEEEKWQGQEKDMCLLLLRVFVKAKESLTILETSLAGEAEPALVSLLLYLAALAEVASSPRLLTSLPGEETTEVWMERARGRADSLGSMFLADCRAREEEILVIKEALRVQEHV